MSSDDDRKQQALDLKIAKAMQIEQLLGGKLLALGIGEIERLGSHDGGSEN